MEGLVISKNADLFGVDCDGKSYIVKASGKTKQSGIYVGDYVQFDKNITKVLPRKNILIRPPVANIDKLFIVFSQLPKPDFVLVDKMIIYCHLNSIEPILVINKEDICDEGFINEVKSDYRQYEVLVISAQNGEIAPLKNKLKGMCVMAGQSGVGKSSIINALLKGGGEKVGAISKIKRGRQTTRLVKLFKIGKNYLADTAGFSLLDLQMVSNLQKEELSSYYPDFLEGRALCKYRSCLHEGGECGVIKKVREGEISQNRYNNYLKILQELKEAKRY